MDAILLQLREQLGERSDRPMAALSVPSNEDIGAEGTMSNLLTLLKDTNVQVALFLTSSVLFLTTSFGWITWPSPWAKPALLGFVVLFGVLTLFQFLNALLPRR